MSTTGSHCLRTFPRETAPGSRPRLTSAMLTRTFAGSVPPRPLRRLGWQISPGKNMIFPCTTAAFTIPRRSGGLRHVVLTRPGVRPYMQFLSVGSQVCSPASFSGSVALPRLAFG